MSEFAVLFDNGAWHVMERWSELQPATLLGTCPTFEDAIREVALRTGGKVLIKLITSDDQS